MTAAFAALLLAAAPCDAELSLAVLAVGDNPTHVVQAQKQAEELLGSSERVCVIGGEQIARAFPAEPLDYERAFAKVEEPAAKMLAEAKDAYYRNNLAQALDRLGALRALYGRSYVPAPKRVDLYLWRTAVYLAMEDASQARREVREALNIDSALVVDPKVFRPSVAELVGSVREEDTHQFTITLKGLPDGATVVVDDKPVAPVFEATRGRHWVVVQASGRRTFSRALKVSADKTLRVPLPFVADEALTTFSRQALDGEATRVPDSLAEALADQLEVDALLVVTPTGASLKGVLLSTGADRSVIAIGQPSVAAPTEFVTWAKTELEKAANALVVATEPNVEPIEPWAWSVSVASTVRFRSRTSTSNDGRSFTLPFVGTGPAVRVNGRWTSLVWDVGATYVSYDITEIQTALPDGTAATVRGGSALRAHGSVGYRLYVVRRLGSGSPWVEALGAASYDTHSTRDVENVGGGPTGLISALTRTSIGATIGGGYPLPMGNNTLRLSAVAGLYPVQLVSESPSGTNGTIRNANPEIGGQLAASYGGSRWSVDAAVSAAVNQVQFRGTAASVFDPELTDVQIAQTIYAVTIGASFSF